MTEQSKTLEIMRRIGAPKLETIRITGIIQSPELAALILALPGEDSDSSTALLSLLGSHEVNIRFISKYYDSTGNTSVCLCIDAGSLDTALELIDANESSGTGHLYLPPQRASPGGREAVHHLASEPH
jgi:hypothetical protein